MVERRRLNADFLDNVTPPKKGERWVADTVVRGFGLRLWAGGKGGGGSFCVRTTDNEKRSVRRTYDPFDSEVGVRDWLNDYTKHLRHQPDNHLEAEIPLRFLLDDARRWARWIIGQSKGTLPSVEAERHAQDIDNKNVASIRQHLSDLTLGTAIERLIDNREKSGFNTIYLDQLLNVSTKIAHDFQNTPIGDLTREHVLSILYDPSIRPGNRNLIRQLMRDVLHDVQNLGGPRVKGRYPTYGRYTNYVSDDSIDDFVSSLAHPDFRELFRILEAEKVSWRQANCIRLSFEFSSPLSRIMSARWDQVIEDQWYPYIDSGFRYWLYRRARINDPACHVLSKISKLGQANFGNNPYLFPSPGSKHGHIENVDRLWKRALAELEWRPYSIGSYREHYQSLTRFRYWPHSKNYGTERGGILTRLSKLPQLEPNTQDSG